MYKQLRKVIDDLIHELEIRQNRRKYNMYAGVCQKSIEAQGKEISRLEQRIEALEYTYQHKLL